MADLEKLDETTSLISAGKVTGTPVYSTESERLGEIKDVMLDKRSGKIAYSVMSFGGFLGLGERYHPLPWASAWLVIGGFFFVTLALVWIRSLLAHFAPSHPFERQSLALVFHEQRRTPPSVPVGRG